jgi:hypothetical protein
MFSFLFYSSEPLYVGHVSMLAANSRPPTCGKGVLVGGYIKYCSEPAEFFAICGEQNRIYNVILYCPEHFIYSPSSNTVFFYADDDLIHDRRAAVEIAHYLHKIYAGE